MVPRGCIAAGSTPFVCGTPSAGTGNGGEAETWPGCDIKVVTQHASPPTDRVGDPGGWHVQPQPPGANLNRSLGPTSKRFLVKDGKPPSRQSSGRPVGPTFLRHPTPTTTGSRGRSTGWWETSKFQPTTRLHLNAFGPHHIRCRGGCAARDLVPAITRGPQYFLPMARRFWLLVTSKPPSGKAAGPTANPPPPKETHHERKRLPEEY